MSKKLFHDLNFNPRSREGSDGLLTAKMQRSAISIHAPARGATIEIPASSNFVLFQSTLPRGERLQFYLKFTLCF